MNPTHLIEYFNLSTNEVAGTIKTKTPVKMNKKDVETKTIPNPFGEVFKLQEVNVVFNPKYEAAVNEQRGTENKEQDFQSQERKWGKKVNGSIVENNGAFYLSVIEQDKIDKPIYVDSDMNEIAYAEFEQFMPKKKLSKGTQDLEQAVKYRTYKLDNIQQLTVAGETLFIQ